MLDDFAFLLLSVTFLFTVSPFFFIVTLSGGNEH